MSLYSSSKLTRNSSPIKADESPLWHTENTPKASSYLVPLCLIGREALPLSINEMDMPAVTDVSSCSAGFRNTIGWFDVLFVELIDSLLIILSRRDYRSLVINV